MYRKDTRALSAEAKSHGSANAESWQKTIVTGSNGLGGLIYFHFHFLTNEGNISYGIADVLLGLVCLNKSPGQTVGNIRHTGCIFHHIGFRPQQVKVEQNAFCYQELYADLCADSIALVIAF